MTKYKGDEKVKKSFEKLIEKEKPKPKVVKNSIRAFIVGGLICVLGQFIKNTLLNYGISEEHVSSLVPIILVFLGALLTGLGWYEKIAEFAGAGTVVPITGFSNSIVSPAIEFKKEGFVMGVGAKMFTIAGPVLVYGIGTSVIVGLIYYALMYFKVVG
ncbi:stage V sporulation protein AC [Clostridium tarantellae]|uniref:Stage V sporulation protein AC n=1 Tax=Clostridium tarantellae TaxID=39493 RepID=A0A6I1MHE5_9CLOT|nr:stage V sporulation protein AC [Clostridium tarantellae]MPQ42264.1 stage V sporulation protein AC [Clostridium tarantellae]